MIYNYSNKIIMILYYTKHTDLEQLSEHRLLPRWLSHCSRYCCLLLQGGEDTDLVTEEGGAPNPEKNIDGLHTLIAVKNQTRVKVNPLV